MPVKKARRGRVQIDAQLALARFREPTIQKKFRKAMIHWDKKTGALIEAVRSAERLDENDFAIRINAKG